MRWEQLAAAFSAPNKRALFSLMRLMKGQVRLLCLSALVESGAMRKLASPKTAAELADELDMDHADLLQPLLDLGVSLGELRQDGDTYRCKGALATAVSTPEGEALAAFLQEQVHYHSQVFRDLPQRLHDGEKADYLATAAPLISKGSRIVEAFMRPFAARLLQDLSQPRILEIGCGEGAFLQWCSQASAESHGVGLDQDPQVAQQAVRNLREWGVPGFEVQHGDILNPPQSLQGPFDLIAAFQNVYYFSREDRVRLFDWVKQNLEPQGVFAMVTAVDTDRMAAHYFSIILGSTQGCWPLPTMQELEADLREAGFTSVRKDRLVPCDEFWGIRAS